LACSTFWPTQPSWSPSSSSRIEVEHASQRQPADLTPPPWSAQTTSTEGKKSPRHPFFISQLNGALSPLQSFGNWHLPTGSIEAPSTPAIEGTRLAPPQFHPIKGHPTPGEDPHTSNSPSLSPHHARVIILRSRGSTTGAPPHRRLPSLSTSQNILPVAPSFFSPPCGKTPWPGAAARPSAGEFHSLQWWPVHHGPRPALVHEP
jgi:hypothetical protein